MFNNYINFIVKVIIATFIICQIVVIFIDSRQIQIFNSNGHLIKYIDMVER